MTAFYGQKFYFNRQVYQTCRAADHTPSTALRLPKADADKDQFQGTRGDHEQ